MDIAFDLKLITNSFSGTKIKQLEQAINHGDN